MRIAAGLVLLGTLVAGEALAQVRVQGTVTDEEGKPVAGAKVTLQSDRAGIETATTDRRGKWGALLEMGGPWNIDIEAEGFVPTKGSIQLSEVGRTPPLKTTIRRVPEPEPEPEPEVASTVPPEAVEAVRKGEEFLAQKMFKEAVVEFEKAQAILPDHLQLKQALARAYYGAGQIDEAVGLLKQVHAADPTNNAVNLLLVNLLLEQGKLEEGKTLLQQLPQDAIEDPMILVNVGILFINKENPREAHDYFTRAIGVDPERGESYYYRALAAVQLQRLDDAKADFEKAIELAPDSSEAAEAAEMLKQFK
ncbi:MAG TPA: tetratricopeptide repeat protein [Thermoanaerobaculia bacterium]|nr:tetratricopeptide repeat protein [Thermoanaerobaculia bacterium]